MAHARKIAAGDLETDPFSAGRVPECFLSGVFDGRTHHVWEGPGAAESCAKWCLKFRGIVYFHNGGNFDFHYLLPFLPLADCRFFMIGKRIVQIKCGAMELRDSYAILPIPLSATGEKIEIEIEKLNRNRRRFHMDEIKRYMQGDNSALYHLVSDFIGEFGLNLTLASTAFRVLRKQFGITISRTTSRFDRSLRKHYFAGRVEFTSLGRHRGRFEVYDINSAFPHAMTFPHFYSATYVLGDKLPKKHREQSFYEVDCVAGGALAQRDADGGVSFPRGQGHFFTTGWELFAGLKSGAIKRLKIRLVMTPRKVRDFGEFVRHYYHGKAEARAKAAAFEKAGDMVKAYYWRGVEYRFKLVLNSCYGKFGQDVTRYTDVFWTSHRAAGGEAELPDDRHRDTWVPILDDHERGLTLWERPAPRKPGNKGEFYNVAVAASITGKVRAEIHQAMRASRRVLYCDTDSLIGEKVVVPKGEGLGEWKLERVFDVFWCGGKKLYIGHDAAFPWKKKRPTWTKKDFVKTRMGKAAPYVYVSRLGWTKREAFKMASKGVNLTVEDLIDVCEGKERVSRQAAPTYSLKRGTRFIERRVRRADKRGKP
jgi:hypothetical protein